MGETAGGYRERPIEGGVTTTGAVQRALGTTMSTLAGVRA